MSIWFAIPLGVGIVAAFTAAARRSGRGIYVRLIESCPVRSLLNVSVSAVLTAFAPSSAIAGVSPSATIVGVVTLTGADGGTFSGEGVRVTLACAADGTTRTEVSDEHGAFRFLNLSVDRCSIQADLQGFVAQPVSVVTVADQVVATDLHLGVVPLRVGVNVGGTVPYHEPKILRGSRQSAVGRRLERAAKWCTRWVTAATTLVIL
jgi:hypothetical protein